VLLGDDSLLFLPENVTKAARQRGKLFGIDAEDYFFIAFNDFPWHSVQDVIVGRPAYDNYLVGLAIKRNVTVVDATSTLLALHQTDKDGNFAGHRNKDAGFNSGHIGAFDYQSGRTTEAQYVTKYTVDEVCNRTKITVERRRKARRTTKYSSLHQVRSANLSTRPTTTARALSRQLHHYRPKKFQLAAAKNTSKPALPKSFSRFSHWRKKSARRKQ